ncbi:MAG: FecR domain-containing protein [Deltaproteobacteria bacterium]|nr:FecR domain-containing protein [Deltaproteobacteria bacterium]MBN2671693.1 FecR domain-containing protein [Deltaproteobacteria bacterium]
MTKRIFRNQYMLNALKTELHQQSAVSDAQLELNKRKLAAVVQHDDRSWRHHRILWAALAASAAFILIGVATFIYLNWTHPLPPALTPRDITHSVNTAPLEMQGLVSIPPLYQDIEVPVHTGAKFIMADDSTIWTAEESRLRLQSSLGELHLASGRILATYSKRAEHTSIRTPNGTIEILGTTFAITASASSLEVRLFEGKIALHLKGEVHNITQGTYIRVEGNQLVEQRIIDRSDIISALLVTEKTFHLPGPKVPELSVPQPRAAIIPMPKKKTEKKEKHRPSQKKNRDSTTAETPDSSTIDVVSPEPDDMVVEIAEPGPTKQNTEAMSEAERLLEDACRNMKNGNHAQGKEQIREYLKLHPKDRFWQHVNSIFE